MTRRTKGCLGCAGVALLAIIALATLGGGFINGLRAGLSGAAEPTAHPTTAPQGSNLCPTQFTEQKVDVSGQVVSIDPIGKGVYLGLVKDAAGLPCEFLTTERPALNSQFTLKSYIAHRNDQAQPTEFLYPTSAPRLAAGTSAAL